MACFWSAGPTEGSEESGMNVKVEQVSSIKKKMVFEVAAEQVDKEIQRALRKIGKTAKVKGFRQGKVPHSVLEKYYGGQIEQDVLGRLINDTYFKALVEHEVPVVGEPNIIDSSGIIKGEVFTYTAEVEVKPVVQAKDYTGLSLQKELLTMDPELVDKRIEELLQSRTEVQVSKRKKAREGDTLVIDFAGRVDGEPFEGGQGEDFSLELGSATFIPGFEEQLVGMKREEVKDINVTFPEDYGQKDLAGKPAVFTVTLKEIKEKVVPEADDEFAKGFGIDSLEALKKELEEGYRRQEASRIDNDLREGLVQELIRRNPIDVPDAMVAKQLEYMYQNIVSRMRSQGMTPQMLGMTQEGFMDQYRPTAVSQVQGSLILEAIGDQENIEVDDAEIDAKFEEIAAMANASLDAVKKHYASDDSKSGLLAQIREEKVIRFLLDKATVEEVPAEQLAGDKAGEEGA
jgi:trigger factor